MPEKIVKLQRAVKVDHVNYGIGSGFIVKGSVANAHSTEAAGPVVTNPPNLQQKAQATVENDLNGKLFEVYTTAEVYSKSDVQRELSEVKTAFVNSLSAAVVDQIAEKVAEKFGERVAKLEAEIAKLKGK